MCSGLSVGHQNVPTPEATCVVCFRHQPEQGTAPPTTSCASGHGTTADSDAALQQRPPITCRDLLTALEVRNASISRMCYFHPIGCRTFRTLSCELLRARRRVHTACSAKEHRNSWNAWACSATPISDGYSARILLVGAVKNSKPLVKPLRSACACSPFQDAGDMGRC